ncbi:hypothetical protein [Tabrizicola sp.]|uniref:hypothetical protein n=1 Tax=Tabrizicola sp. TaxID=2005166 RepID=UPI003F3E37F2
MSEGEIDSRPFRELMRPGEDLIWSAKPVLKPIAGQLLIWLWLAAVGGVLAAVYLALVFSGRLSTTERLFQGRCGGSGRDVFLALLAVGIAIIVLMLVRGGRRRLAATSYAMSDHRLFMAVERPNKSELIVGTKLTNGRVALTRERDLTGLSIEVRGQANDAESDAYILFEKLSQNDATAAMAIINQTVEP